MIFWLLLIVVFVLIGGGMWGWPLLAGLLGATQIKDKSSALNNIVRLMQHYDVSPAEVEAAFREPALQDAAPKRSRGDVAKTLFVYLGAIFILSGIGTYVGMFWDSMGSVMHVVVTLGVGYVLLIVLVSALHEGKYPRLIFPLSIAAVLVMTGGWFVLVHEVFPHGDNWRKAALTVFGVMGVQQAALFAKYRLTVLAFTALFFAYGFMQIGLDLLDVPAEYTAIILGASLFLVGAEMQKTAYRILSEPALLIGAVWMNSGLFDVVATHISPNWASLLIGTTVMLTGYGFQKDSRHARLAGLAYFFGSVMAYAGLFDLVQGKPFELAYLAVSAAMLYACVELQSRALLFTSVIAMLGYIGYFTAKHFANSLGWPITLVLMGVAFLGVGTIAIKVRRQI